MTQSKFATWPLYPRFVLALLTGRKVSLRDSPGTGKMAGWKEPHWKAVVDIAASQLAAQRASLDRLLGRAQLLFTTLLGLSALLVGLAVLGQHVGD